MNLKKIYSIIIIMDFLKYINDLSFFKNGENDYFLPDYCFFTDSDLIDDKYFIYNFLKNNKF